MAMTVRYETFAGELISENRGGTETFYTSDTLGSVIECRDDTGTKIYGAEYWAYGEVRTSTGSNPSPWFFVGTLGYHGVNFVGTYVRARVLRSSLARWMTVDPLWPWERAFVYCDNNPVRLVDPFGEQGVIGPAPKGFVFANPQFEGCEFAKVNVAVRRACDELACCYNYPPCRKALLRCFKDSGLPAGALDCMLRKCIGKDTFTLSCNNGNIACCAYGRCGQTPSGILGYGGGCHILLCPDNISKPECGDGDYTWNFMHELSHCCGSSDDNDQADDLGNSISEAVRIHKCRF